MQIPKCTASNVYLWQFLHTHTQNKIKKRIQNILQWHEMTNWNNGYVIFLIRTFSLFSFFKQRLNCGNKAVYKAIEVVFN